MRKIFLSIAIVLLSVDGFAQQVTKNVILEHFTNTYCPPCASRNPDLYVNLANHPSVLHVSYHPSSPYPSCTLYQHNMTENDARTHYYSVYGSTPRIVLQGNALPANTQFSDTGLFTAAMEQLSSFDVSVSLSLIFPDSIRVRARVLKVDTSSLTTARIYVGVLEDTLLFTSNNGEAAHYDVFRRSAFGEHPVTLPMFPTTVGDSTVVMVNIPVSMAWDLEKVYAMAILHDETDSTVIQAARSGSVAGLSVSQMASGSQIDISPNPASGYVQVTGMKKGSVITIRSVNGSTLLQQTASGSQEKVDVSSLPAGVYFMAITSGGEARHFKLLKQ